MLAHDAGLRSLACPFTTAVNLHPILSAKSADDIIQVLPPSAMVILATASSHGNGHHEFTNTLALIHTHQHIYAGLSFCTTAPGSD